MKIIIGLIIKTVVLLSLLTIVCLVGMDHVRAATCGGTQRSCCIREWVCSPPGCIGAECTCSWQASDDCYFHQCQVYGSGCEAWPCGIDTIEIGPPETCSWSGGPTPTPGPTPEPPPPPTEYVNCANLTVSGVKDGSGNLIKGNAYTLSAYYYTTGRPGRRVMKVIAGTDCNDVVFSGNTAGSNGVVSFEWTPTATGTYTVYCRSSATAYASCSGYKPPCDPTADYACAGPRKKKTVNVVDSCTLTDPVINSVILGTFDASNNYNATVNWTRGTVMTGSTQEVYSDNTESRVIGNCTDACEVDVTGLANTLVNYNTVSYPTPYPLLPNYVEYWKVRNYESASCEESSVVYPSLLKCTVSPASLSLQIDDTATLTSGVLSAADVRVKFKTNDPNVVKVNGASAYWDDSYPYNVSVNATGVGTTTVTTEVYVGGRAAFDCETTTNVEVAATGPWWQVKDGDATAGGDIRSVIFPAGVKFILNGAGGYPGVAAFAGSSNLTTANVSSKGWLANSDLTGVSSNSSYDYLRDLIPSTWWNGRTPITAATISSPTYFTSTGTAMDGYKLFYRSGNLNISADQNVLGQRVLLFVEGDLTINNNLILDDGAGFFMAVVTGNIIVGSPVSSLEGFYSADNQFRTGMGSAQLTVRGSVVGINGVSLQRDLGAVNTTTPAEKFEYAPDLVFTYPSKLTVRKMRWKEVAP